MNTELLQQSFTENNTPNWICPTCNKGILRIKKGSFITEALKYSRENCSHEYWEPHMYEGVYTCILVCLNSKCEEFVVNSGDVSVREEEDEYEGIIWTKYFSPKYFEPHLRLIHIPSKCPLKIKEALNESSKLFFLSPNAAANSIRIAIEELLTAMKIKRFSVSKGKRRIMTLHQRIECLPIK